MSVIRVSGLQKLYGDVVAVSDVNLEVGMGEVVGLLGPSGCGKTTTLRCIAGLETPSGGTIELAGEMVDSPTDRVPAEKRGVGMVFQSYALWPHMTVAKNVAFPLDYVGSATKAERPARVRAALEAVGLEGYDGRYPGELSGGQQQRVAVARAIVSEPSVLLFDEPLSNLDAKLRNHVRIELKLLLRRLDATAVYVTHDQREAMALCDRIAVMDGGVVRQIGTPEEVYEHPVDVFVSAFVGDTNVLEFDPVDESASRRDSRQVVGLAGLDLLVEPGQLPRECVHGGSAALRPEDITLRRTTNEEAGGWEGRVVERLYLGAFVQYLVAIHGARVTLTVDSRGEAFAVGDRCVAVPKVDKIVWIPRSPSDSDRERRGGVQEDATPNGSVSDIGAEATESANR